MTSESEITSPALFAPGIPGLRVFWTAYDPLDLASDSIDPLGFMAGYIALADRILPGFTTITTVPRYAGMLCCALDQARTEVGDHGSVSLSARRKQTLEHLQSFERAWALACGFAEQDGKNGGQATEGLRGLRAVRRQLALFGGNQAISLAYNLLANQVRYGGIGAYSTFLEALHLADMNTLALRPLGEELARAFPSPGKHGLGVLRENVRLPVEGLRAWGVEAHAGTLTTEESRLLRYALQGGEETDFDDQTRWTMLRMLCACDPTQELNEPQLLSACFRRLKRNGTSEFDTTEQSARRIRSALQVIEPYERMYQCATFVFDQIRVVTAKQGQANLQTVGRLSAIQAATNELRNAAAKFVAEIEAATDARDNLGAARLALAKLRLLELGKELAATAEPVTQCQQVLHRHLQVQENKFDGGLRKQPWIELEKRLGQTAKLTAQRFGLETTQTAEAWTGVSHHPYRTFGARRFIRQCRIR